MYYFGTLSIKYRITLFIIFLSVDMFAEVQVSHREENIVLENKFIKAEISPYGGRIISLFHKPSNTETVLNSSSDYKEGAARDHLLPVYKNFACARHNMKVTRNTPRKAEVTTFSRGTNAFSFVEMTKTFTLLAESPRLDISVNLKNTPESMGEIDIAYASHNFYILPGQLNTVFLPLRDGIKSFQPSAAENKKYNNIPVRGWIGLAGSKGAGVVSLYNLSYSDISFSWFCGMQNSSVPPCTIQTLEWHLKSVPVPAGQSYRIEHSVALTNDFRKFSGAGKCAAGLIEIPDKLCSGTPVKARIALYGLEKRKISLQVKLNDFRQNFHCQLQPGETTEWLLQIPGLAAGTQFLICDILDENGEKLFDLYEKIQVGDKVTGLEMTDFPPRKKIAGTNDVWDIPLETKSVNPEFNWSRNAACGKRNTLVLMPTMGVRDIIELAGRSNITFDFPTIFPGAWTMAWKDKVLRPGETGIPTLNQYFSRDKHYDLFIIGGSFNPQGDTHFSWNKLPVWIREKILTAVEKGAGLLYINPDGPDEKLNKILTALDHGEKARQVLSSMDLTAAPLFSRTKIRCGRLGAGKIVTVTYPPGRAFLVPSRSKWNTPGNLVLDCPYDYYDYQFAVLAKLILFISGNAEKNEIALGPQSQGILKYTSAPDVKTVEYAIYNQYGEKLSSQKVKANGQIFLPSLPHGANRIKIKALNTAGQVLDIAFQTLRRNSEKLLSKIIWSRLPIHAGEKISGRVAVQGKLPAEAVIEVQITDTEGRLVHQSRGQNFTFDTALSLTLAHVISARILRQGIIMDILKERFCVVGAGQENYYPAMLWTGHPSISDYGAPHLMKAAAEYGFSLLYSSYPEASSLSPLCLSPIEVSANTFAGASGVLRTPSVMSLRDVPKLQKIRKPCLNDPSTIDTQKRFVHHALKLMKNFGSERYFNLGDEMSITWYTTPVDICFSQYCLPKYREFLKTLYPSLDALNRHWETSFSSWDKVTPMIFEEVLLRENAAPWSTHRAFMDKLFAENIEMQANEIKKVYPAGYYGPTGLAGKPHVYGGGCNFETMRHLTMLSSYDVARIPLSFDRLNRIIMYYRGYKHPKNLQIMSYWEGLFAGERGANHWYTWSFFLPDYSVAKNRSFYSRELQELRSGTAALLVNSHKFTDEVAILYSHPSVRANFLKEEKLEIHKNLLSFARYCEDRALGYRYILPEDLENGTLKRFKILVLPEATAMSARQAQSIRNFVREGGFLLADYETALEDEWNVPCRKGMLDELMGIRQTGRGFTTTIPSKEIPLDKCAQAHTADGIPQALLSDQFNRKIPVLISKKTGKGQTLFLNFPFRYIDQREKDEHTLRHLMDRMLPVNAKYSPVMKADGSPAERIMTVFYKNGNHTYIGLLPELPRGNWKKASESALQKKAFPVRISLPGLTSLYSVRDGQYYGAVKEQKLSLTPGHAVLLACLPYRVTGIKLQSPASLSQGKTARFTADIQTNGAPAGHHVFHMEVKMPDGSRPWFFRQVKETHDGHATFDFPVAHNAPKGKYEITITDAATKISRRVIAECL